MADWRTILSVLWRDCYRPDPWHISAETAQSVWWPRQGLVDRRTAVHCPAVTNDWYLKESDRLWGPASLLCNGHVGNLGLWLSGRSVKLSSWGQKWVVLYFHLPIFLYGVIRDTTTAHNLRNFLYETNVTLYDICRVVHKAVKHFKISQQINYSTDPGSSYAGRERNSPSFFFLPHIPQMLSVSTFGNKADIMR